MSGWADLVTAATIGTDSQPVDPSSLPEDLRTIAAQVKTSHPAAQLLDVAALYTVASRAGQVLLEAPPIPAPAPPDVLPEISTPAAGILDRLIDGNRESRLSDALLDIAEAGYRAPAATLPALLNVGTHSVAARPPIQGVLGKRGRWLASTNRAWRWVGETDTSASGGTDPDIWETGTAAERLGWFSRARRNNPAEARGLLATGWAKEAPDARENLIRLLEPELEPSDEPFLEHALDDRRAAVRAGARKLLALLPDSGWQNRMRDRAARAMVVEQKRVRRSLVVHLPSECDASMVRDGITLAAPEWQKIGQRAHWLRQVIALAPLDMWPDAVDAWELKAADSDGVNYTVDVRIAWFDATVEQRNVEWARVIFGAHYRPVRAQRSEERLLALLPPAEQIDLIIDMLPTAGLHSLTWIPNLHPWTQELSTAVLENLRTATRRTERQPWNVQEGDGCEIAARRLPAGVGGGHPDYLAQLREILATTPATSRSQPWVSDMIEAVASRRRLLEELS